MSVLTKPELKIEVAMLRSLLNKRGLSKANQAFVCTGTLVTIAQESGTTDSLRAIARTLTATADSIDAENRHKQ